MPSKVPSIAVGAAVSAVLALLTNVVNATAGQGNQVVGALVACLCCLGAVGCGVIAVYHYTNTHHLTISPGSGAGMGAAAGFLGMIIASILGYLLQFVGVLPTAAEALATAREQMIDAGMPDDQIETALTMTRYMTGPLGIVVSSVVGAILGAIGGAIGAAMFKKGGDPMLVDDTI